MELKKKVIKEIAAENIMVDFSEFPFTGQQLPCSAP
jgi:hypothetical protein